MCFIFSKHRKQFQVGGVHKTVPVLETSKIRGPWFTTHQPSFRPNDGILANHFLGEDKKPGSIGNFAHFFFKLLDRSTVNFSNFLGTRDFLHFLFNGGVRQNSQFETKSSPQLPRTHRYATGTHWWSRSENPHFLDPSEKMVFFQLNGIRLESLKRNVWLEFISNGRSTNVMKFQRWKNFE